MSDLASSSTSVSDDNILEFDEGFTRADNETTNDSEAADSPFIDARRRLEAMLDDRNLEKDIKEFDFDID